MISVVNKHSHFTLDKVKELSPTMVAMFDAFNCSNDLNTKNFLYVCLKSSLATDLKKWVPADASFTVVWAQLVQKTQDMSTDQYTKLADGKIKYISILKYPSQGVEQMSANILALAFLLAAKGSV